MITYGGRLFVDGRKRSLSPIRKGAPVSCDLRESLFCGSDDVPSSRVFSRELPIQDLPGRDVGLRTVEIWRYLFPLPSMCVISFVV